jgi:beta-phosphoglucomutase-like phosphatase (HAD superfamily)
MRRSSFLQAGIFDVEGTLIDCVPLQLESWRQTLGAAGHSFTYVDLQPFSGIRDAQAGSRLNRHRDEVSERRARGI